VALSHAETADPARNLLIGALPGNERKLVLAPSTAITLQARVVIVRPPPVVRRVFEVRRTDQVLEFL
jgi:hypothetical protein